MELTPRRVGAWLGVIGAAVSFVGIAIAIALGPWFSVTANALSDLGVPGRASAPAFNGGLMVGGVLGLGFAARLWSEAHNAVGRAGVAILGLALLNMALIGVFPKPHPYHLTVSAGFFLCFTYALFVYGSGQALAGRVRDGLLAVWLGVAHVTGWLAWGVSGIEGLAIPEAFGALILGAWVVWTTLGLRE